MKTYKGLEQRCLFLLQICILIQRTTNLGQEPHSMGFARLRLCHLCKKGTGIIRWNEWNGRNHPKVLKNASLTDDIQRDVSFFGYSRIKLDWIIIELVHNSFQHVAEAVQTTASWSPGRLQATTWRLALITDSARKCTCAHPGRSWGFNVSMATWLYPEPILYNMTRAKDKLREA